MKKTKNEDVAGVEASTRQEQQQDIEQNIFRELANLRRLSAESGYYVALPPESLLKRGETLYNTNMEQIRQALTAKDVDEDTINTVLYDYAKACVGGFVPTATPEQIKKTLDAIPPYRAFYIDRYGFYYGLLLRYACCMGLCLDYMKRVKDEATATTETRRAFICPDEIDAPATIDTSVPVMWLIEQKIMTPTDFADVDLKDVAIFARTAQKLADVWAYTTLYTIAKFVLLATPEELDQITAPDITFSDTGVNVSVFADVVADNIKRELDALADTFNARFEAEKKAERERAEQAAKNWESEENAVLQLHETPNIICSRPVKILPYGAELPNALPIQRFIDDFSNEKQNEKYGLITKGTIQKVVEAVNLLPNFLRPNDRNGQLEYRTTINEFSKMCGYVDAGQDTQRALLGALLIISDQYFVVVRPRKVITRTTLNGRKRRIQTGGPTTTRLVAVDIENETGGLIIKISPEAMTGKPRLIRRERFELLRETASKNGSRSRFNYQLMDKPHKNGEDMLNEVFGYDEKLEDAANDPDAFKKAKDYIRKHRGDDRKRLVKWFDESLKNGTLESYDYNEKTDAYSWVYAKDITEQTDEQ